MGAGLWPTRATLGARGWLCVGLCDWCWLGLPFGCMVVVMSCCEKYRDCNQGRNCPLRASSYSLADQLLISTFKRLFRRFFYWLLIAIFGMLWLALLVACTYAYAN
jgi:hypothetical protein